MTAAPRGLPECPPVIAAMLQRLPAYPGSVIAAAALNAVLARQLPPDVAQLLRGRSFRIQVTDARLAIDFGWNGTRFTALRRQPRPDLTISASGPDFLRMARREEDPDTLFFSRRLSMEGDTELGLVVKNTLDALDLPVLDAGLLRRLPSGASPQRRGRAPWN